MFSLQVLTVLIIGNSSVVQLTAVIHTFFCRLLVCQQQPAYTASFDLFVGTWSRDGRSVAH